jgi:hypothetical protein
LPAGVSREASPYAWISRPRRPSSSAYDLTRINTLRYPAYHRLDVRVEKRLAFGRWTLDASLDVQNVYNRRNVYYRYWDDGRERTVYYFPIVPFVGLRAGF